jgi:hypothetical protein
MILGGFPIRISPTPWLAIERPTLTFRERPYARPTPRRRRRRPQQEIRHDWAYESFVELLQSGDISGSFPEIPPTVVRLWLEVVRFLRDHGRASGLLRRTP